MLSDIPDERETLQTGQGQMERQNTETADIDDSYYKSKYKEPVSDFPSDSNQNFAKEMEHIFR